MPKNKIALVAASTAPIPDVLGGGAERLVTMLIEQNEIDNKVEFIVFSIKNKKAKLQAKKYKYTKFVYLVPSNLCEKLYNFIIRAKFNRIKRDKYNCRKNCKNHENRKRKNNNYI